MLIETTIILMLLTRSMLSRNAGCLTSPESRLMAVSGVEDNFDDFVCFILTEVRRVDRIVSLGGGRLQCLGPEIFRVLLL